MKKKSSISSNYSPDGWFLNFLFLSVLIAGLFAATVLVQRRARYIVPAAPTPQVEDIKMDY